MTRKDYVETANILQ